MGALIAEPLYLLADTAVVGHLGTIPLGGLAVASAALLLIYGLSSFLAYGTTATVARFTGAGEPSKATNQAIQSMWLAFFLGIAIAVIGYLAANQLLKILGAEGELLEQARIYLRISMFGAPAMLIMLAGVGYLRGVKDTVRPLWVAIGTALLNLGLELILIYGFNKEIGASAAATVISQWIGALIYLFWIRQAIGGYKVSFKPKFLVLIKLLKSSSELLIRNLSLTTSFIVATAMAARLGNVDVAAHEIGFQAWFFLSMSMDAIAIAAQAITGNLLGAGNAHEARQMGRRAIIWSTGLGCFIGSILAIFHLSFAEIFSEDTAVVELAGFLLLHVAAMAPLSGVAFALDGILIGAGDQRFLAKAMSFSAVISVPLMLLSLAFGLGIGWIWGSIWILMLTRSTTLYIRFRSDKWQKLGS
ncbi:MAG: MATE family efflux transporter [Acidimicrobiales bacterium]|nr:MATE family efflux transporter [Acidimicrobiales bacterium]